MEVDEVAHNGNGGGSEDEDVDVEDVDMKEEEEDDKVQVEPDVSLYQEGENGEKPKNGEDVAMLDPKEAERIQARQFASAHD